MNSEGCSMKKVLIDINILLDMIAERDDFHSATAVFDLCAKRKIKGYVSSHEITTLGYLLERYSLSHAQIAEIITGILDTFNVIPIGERLFRKALNSPIRDFEDAVIEVCAMKEEIDFIITRNLKDFQNGRVECHTAGELAAILDLI